MNTQFPTDFPHPNPNNLIALKPGGCEGAHILTKLMIILHDSDRYQ